MVRLLGRKPRRGLSVERIVLDASLEPAPPQLCVVAALRLALGDGLGVPAAWLDRAGSTVRIVQITTRGAPVRVPTAVGMVAIGQPRILMETARGVQIVLPPTEPSAEAVIDELRRVWSYASRYALAMVVVAQVQPQAAYSAMRIDLRTPWEGGGECIPGRRLPTLLLSASRWGYVARAADGRELELETDSVHPICEYAAAVVDRDLTTVVYVANLMTVRTVSAKAMIEELSKLVSPAVERREGEEVSGEGGER